MRSSMLPSPNPSMVDAFANAGIGAAPSNAENRRFRAYCLRFDTAIAANANAFSDLTIETRENFIISDIQAEFRLSATFFGALPGTPLPRDSSATGANNTMATLGLVRCQISVSDYNWFSAPVPLSLLTGDGRAKGFLTTLPRIAANDRLRVTIFNDTNETGTSATIKGTILLAGYAVDIA